jgi:DNA-binding NtrC family response regulator
MLAIATQMSEKAGPRRDARARVLHLCPHAEERGRVQEMLCEQGMTLHEATTWRDGAHDLKRCQPQVVICEAALPDADWKEVLNRTGSLTVAPRLIVTSSQADDSFWAEVLNLGGYDVLPKPLIKDEVVRVVGLAWQNWKNESERRWKQRAPLTTRRIQNEAS